MNAGRGGAGRSRGFSLLEMLLVMVLIAATGVLAAGVVGGGFARMELRSHVRDIATQLRFTRARALATGMPQTFSIDPAAHVWQGAEGRSGEVPESLGIRFVGAREVQPAEGVGAIVFFGDGASTGGRVRISRGEAAFDIDVAWLTGGVSVHRAEPLR
ncbi:type II secretion system protein XpsH [Luteimonas terricola]|uniref:Type II secretion system protein H n=1 Tax=Luteimonas terricola TaxID=645597 RepID=A0ABQ2E810_9GAMM|nr:GspH/FimT family protein [Luteimonas terricola]GGJ99120.1 type II secretion system protein H [Luteimonas terricola]